MANATRTDTILSQVQLSARHGVTGPIIAAEPFAPWLHHTPAIPPPGYRAHWRVGQSHRRAATFSHDPARQQLASQGPGSRPEDYAEVFSPCPARLGLPGRSRAGARDGIEHASAPGRMPRGSRLVADPTCGPVGHVGTVAAEQVPLIAGEDGRRPAIHASAAGLHAGARTNAFPSRARGTCR
jgi:hypothetical protein